MKPISIFGLGIQSKSNNVTSQKRINLYLEIDVAGDKTNVVAYGTPGLTLFTTLGDAPTRCTHPVGDYVYKVNGSTLWRIDNAGAAATKGSLLTNAGRVGVANNGTQIMFVDGPYGYIYTIATDTFVRITDPDFPGADHVVFNDGYFIFNNPNTGKFFVTSSYDGLNVDALDYATAESSPDKLVRPVTSHGELILMGEKTTEVWVNRGGTDFPYIRNSGASMEWGLAARWSVAEFDNTLIWLARNPMGEVQVVRLNGYNPQRVSTADIETIINSYIGLGDATGFSYLLNGHPFYQLNFTAANASWLYDGASNCWSELKSGTGRHRAELAANYLDRIIVCDYQNGNIYNLDTDAYTDNGAMIVSELVTKHVFADMERYSISELVVDMEAGVGLATGQGSDPQIMLQTSKDGGHTWGNERWADIGKMGEYIRRAKWSRLGQARNWTFRIRVSDPVKRVITGAYIKGG